MVRAETNRLPLLFENELVQRYNTDFRKIMEVKVTFLFLKSSYLSLGDGRRRK